jgi:hypothetical protein
MIMLAIGESGSLRLTQHGPPPTVYLDHWALRAFSEVEELAARFIPVLKARGGTLALSWVNLLEFSKVTSREQASLAENFIEEILPRVFFIECNPSTVIEREDQLLAGGPPVAPHGDPEFLREFARLKPTSPKPFTSRDLFSIMADRDRAARMDKLADVFVGRVEALRDKLSSDPSFHSILGKRATEAPIQVGRRDILRELVRGLLVDRQTKISRNHAIDWFHAVVPIAYCDLVLVDKYWQEQADRVRSRFARAGMRVPMAEVFSKSKDGIERFLQQLTAWA